MSKAKEKEAKTFLDEEIDLRESYSKAEHFIHDNRNRILLVVGVVALVLALFFGFNNIYLPGQEKSAQADMFVAQQYFKKDSFNLALNGDGNNPGFLQIIDDYSGMTNAANLSNYYAGICYLNLGKFDEAVKYLSKFSSDDPLIGAIAYGALGDAYSELGKMDKAIDNYEKAANTSKDEFSAPLNLMKAGLAMETQGNYKGAKGLYEEIKKSYPESQQGREIDKYIARAESKL
ncbi:tetratricopeptide repeat protein [Sphingobacteriales bacterium UPWRP_1]|nr:hypothetical protein B6N25_02160 [Sphingobacteriales bacterium TSM_CSS]PSJ73322.1 tetratricopeptide repeat protein [Sphingobacteriales bacterium UPWRP_1]